MLLKRLGCAWGLGVLSAMFLTSAPAPAHHSTAMYNMAMPVTAQP